MKTNLMKAAIAIICIAISAPVFSQITLPRTPSPAAAVTQTIGISTVTVTYSRPKVNGREIWGKLVPFGYNVEGFGLGNP